MARRKTSQTAETVTVPAEASRLELLEAFTELVGERFGYFVARRLTQQDMADKTKDETKAVRETAKALGKNIDEFIETPTDDLKKSILGNRKKLKDTKETASKAREPFLKKLSPLAKAQKYIDSIAIPDSLKELGKPVQPRFSLSEWVEKAIEQTKKKK